MSQSLLAIGLMSGTSVDGIDAALVRTDGNSLERVATVSSKYRRATRDSIFSAYKNPNEFLQNKATVQDLSMAIAQDHATAANQLKSATDKPVQLIGFHGQTIVHEPLQGKSVQLGDARTLAQLTQVDTVHDFRANDLLAGGQGAPLAPIYHQSLIASLQTELPAAMLNIGGVANLSYWDGSTLIGFDTGPGNGLLDQYMQLNLGQAFDKEGALARQGQVNQALVDDFMQHAFFNSAIPKSLDRAEFNAILKSDTLMAMSHCDAIASLTAMTAASVGQAIRACKLKPTKIIVCGGGQHNKSLLQYLQQAVECLVCTADSLNLKGDYIEAELMGLLAVRHQYALPSTFPSTTGCTHATVAGQLQRAESK